jgi:hypothetical protein
MAVLYVDQVDPQSGTTLTIGTSGDTVTVPSGVTVAGGLSNTPYFFVKLSADQSISGDTATKVALDSEIWDSAGDFASNRFTATTAGKYYIEVGIGTGTGGASSLIESTAWIYKNGAAYAKAYMNYYNNPAQLDFNTVSSIVDFDGSSDYVEAYGSVNGGTEVFNGDSSVVETYMLGYKLIG